MKKYLWILAFAMLTVTACSKESTSLQAAPASVTVKDSKDQKSIVIIPNVDETEEETKEAEQQETEEEAEEERVEKDGKIRSYLTGEMVDVKKANRRPIACMMSNDKAALPQYGINRAGVVYEAPVEAGMNRYMAIIEDYDDLERIGSVRSCRTYYTYFAREFDAIYAHFGQSTFALPYLDNVDNINGVKNGANAFYRSSDRKAPHNAYTSAEKLEAMIQKLGYSQEYDPDYQGHYHFAGKDKEVHLEGIEGDRSAKRIEPGYVLNQPYFLYDESDGLYHRYQYGGVHKGSEGPITAKNVIFQYCPTAHYATTEYLNINVHGSEYGYYFTNGRGIPVSVKKDGEFGVTHYYDKSGAEISLNRGQTWVCIISTAEFDKTKIEE